MIKHVKQGVEFDDATHDLDDHDKKKVINIWSQICNHCVREFQFDTENLDECSGEPICGVANCENVADYYIDGLEEINTEIKI